MKQLLQTACNHFAPTLRTFVCIFFAFVLSMQLGIAQLTGTKTIGAIGNYATFVAAVADLNSVGVGVGGVLFEFIDNGYSETITATVNITAAGTSSNPITFGLGTGVASATLTGSLGTGIVATSAMVALNGALYVTIDGRLKIDRTANNTGDAITKGLTISNTSTNSSSSTILLTTTACTNNTFKYLNLQASNSAAFNAGTVTILTTAAIHTNNVFDYCNVFDASGGTPANGFFVNSVGSINNTISNCNVYNFFQANVSCTGINIFSAGNNWNITNNTLYTTSNLVFTGNRTWTGIFVSNGSGYNITGNTITTKNAGTQYTITGTTNIIKGIVFSGGSTSITNIQNNTIKDIVQTSSQGSTTVGSNVFIGIYVTSGLADVGNITGNTVSGITIDATTTTASTVPAVGILFNSNQNTTISNNQINSISIQNATGTRTGFSGIYVGANATGTNIINQNTIGNTTANNITINTGQASGQVIGINVLSGTGNNTITNNIIRNLNHATAGAGTGSTASVIGILQAATSTQNISNNSIHTLTTTGAGVACVTGIRTTGGSTNNTISNNIIQALNSTGSTVSEIRGIQISGGATTYSNNVIRLGIKADGTNITTGHNIVGIDIAIGGNSNIYFNSIVVAGTSVVAGTQNTYALGLITSGTHNVRNNIFANIRSNTSGTGSNFAVIYHSSATFISDYNIYQANGTGGVLFAKGTAFNLPTATANFQTWRANNVNYDLYSSVGNPQFNNPTATVLDLTLNNPSPAFQTGIAIPSISLDVLSVTRNSTPNIGAYESSSTINASTDIFTPNFIYTPFTNGLATPIVNTRTIDVQITDAGTGIPTSGNVPRIYYKRTAGGSFINTAGVLQSGNGNNGIWRFTIDYSPAGTNGATAGETFYYYFVAQDQASTPNIWYSKFDATTSFTNVSSVITHTPNITLDNYLIITGSGITGIYNLPTDYPSLTGVAGFFNAVNTSVVVGNVTVNITADLTETGTVALNQWAEDLGINFTMLIQPDATTLRTIAGTAVATGTAMIPINGADRLTINGSTGKYLTFRNTNATSANTGSTIEYRNKATSCTLTNCTIENNSTNTTYGSVMIKSLAPDNNQITVSNCDIRDATAGTIGLQNTALMANSPNSLVTFTGNNIFNWTKTGINIQNSVIATITANNFYSTVTATTAQTSIDVATAAQAGGHTITNNTIGGSTNTASGTWINSGNVVWTAIKIDAASSLTTNIQSNQIKNVQMSSTLSSVGIVGISTATNTNSLINTNTITLLDIPNSASPTNFTAIDTQSSALTTISNNTITALTRTLAAGGGGNLRGIRTQGSGRINILNNTITNLTSTGNGTSTGDPALCGIVLFNSTFATVTGNTINDLKLTNTGANNSVALAGITLNSASVLATINNNRIYDLNHSSTSSTGTFIAGINAFNGSLNVYNNQIYLTNALGSGSVALIGVLESTGGLATGIHYNNTVFISGTGATANSYAYRRGVNSTVILRNNLFINNRVGANAYAISNVVGTPSSNWSATASNYNLFAVRDTTNLGEWGTGVSRNFQQWKTSSLGDASSWSVLTTAGTSDHTSINVANLFVNTATGNLNINTANPECWFSNGKGVAIAGQNTDYANNTRNTVYGFGVDIGSHEFNTNTTPIAMNISGTIGTGTQDFTFAGRKLATIVWTTSGTLTSYSQATYYSGINPPYYLSQYRLERYFNNYLRIEVVGGGSYSYKITLYYDDALTGTAQTANGFVISKKPTTSNDNISWKNQLSTVNLVNKTVVTTNNLTSFSDFTITDNSVSLPLVLHTFDATRNNKQVQLNWHTSQETNLKGYQIEKSYDAQNFASINTIDAKSNSNTNQYTFTDTESKATYYRLRYIHHNAPDDISPIRFVKSISNDYVIVYPNPLVGQIKLDISQNLQTVKSINVNVLNSTGKIIETYNGDWDTITKQLNKNYHSWSSGIYFLQIQPINAELHIIKVVK